MSKPIRIGIVAPMGAGKSTLIQILGRAWKGAVVVDEDFKNNPYLEKAYKGIDGYIFKSQLWYLGRKATHIQKIKNKNLIIMVPLMIDMAYAKTYAKLKKISKDDWQTYLDHYNLVTSLADNFRPDILLKLAISDKVLIKRVQERDRKVERKVKPGFLKALNKTINEVCKASKISQIVIDVDNRDYRKLDTAHELVKDIKTAIRKRGYNLPNA